MSRGFELLANLWRTVRLLAQDQQKQLSLSDSLTNAIPGGLNRRQARISQETFQAVVFQACPNGFSRRRIFCRATNKDHTLPISRCEPSHSVPASPPAIYSSAYRREILICAAENPQAL